MLYIGAKISKFNKVIKCKELVCDDNSFNNRSCDFTEHNSCTKKNLFCKTYNLGMYLQNISGVPQDSNVSPLLLLVYIIDISTALNTTPRLFADDTCQVIHAVNRSILCDNVNHELLSILEWIKANKIAVNPKKSSALILPPKTTHPIPTIEILFNNNPVSVNKSVQYLDITKDEKLNFAEHIIKL